MCINIITITIKIKTCPRGEIVDTRLKILALLGVPVRVDEGTIFKMNTRIVISDKNLKSLRLKTNSKNIKQNKTLRSNVILVIGGDGFMLKVLKK